MHKMYESIKITAISGAQKDEHWVKVKMLVP